jgi:hypothetical protein
MGYDETDYFDLFGLMTIRGLLLGGLFGAIYGTLLAPVIGTLLGVFYGAIAGIGLGLGNGLLLVVVTRLYTHFSGLRHYVQLSTMLTTTFSFLAGIAIFMVLLTSRRFTAPDWLYAEIPALIAALVTGWVTQGLTVQLEKRKAKPKEKFS